MLVVHAEKKDSDFNFEDDLTPEQREKVEAILPLVQEALQDLKEDPIFQALGDTSEKGQKALDKAWETSTTPEEFLSELLFQRLQDDGKKPNVSRSNSGDDIQPNKGDDTLLNKIRRIFNRPTTTDD